jgi:hypothetical protein
MKTTKKWGKGSGRNLLLVGISALVLAFGLSAIGCGDPDPNPSPGPGPSGDTVATPTASVYGPITSNVDPSILPWGFDVELSTTTPDARIFYTFDGSNPTTSDTRTEFTDYLYVYYDADGKFVLKAYAIKSGMTDSAVFEKEYQMGTGVRNNSRPSFNRASGEGEVNFECKTLYEGNLTVRILFSDKPAPNPLTASWFEESVHNDLVDADDTTVVESLTESYYGSIPNSVQRYIRTSDQETAKTNFFNYGYAWYAAKVEYTNGSNSPYYTILGEQLE